MENQTTTASAPKKLSPLGLIIGGVVLVALIAGGIYSARHASPEQKQATENVRLMQSVGKLMIVPNEQPIIATINQADVLVKEQAFYNGSQNGDKLVIFPKAQKAVIYSPSRNVIVNSGPFVINSGTTPAPTAPAAAPVKK
jgi:hypothetical protein